MESIVRNLVISESRDIFCSEYLARGTLMEKPDLYSFLQLIVDQVKGKLEKPEGCPQAVFVWFPDSQAGSGLSVFLRDGKLTNSYTAVLRKVEELSLKQCRFVNMRGIKLDEAHSDVLFMI